MMPNNDIINQEFVGNKAKGRISKRVFQEAKHAEISEKQTFLTPWYAHVCFSEILACFAFLKHPFWDSLFYLTTDELVWELESKD